VIVLAQHPATPGHPAPAEVRTVEVTDAAFGPSGLVVAPGTDVTWRNNGRQRHSATADGGAFASPTLSPGDRFTVAAPATAGVYAYGCRFHSYMRGTVTVSMLSLAAPRPVGVGGRPALAGAVPGAAAGTVVHLERRVPGAWQEVGTAATDASGAYGLTGPQITARTAFRALVGDAVSPSVRALVVPAVTVARTGPRLAVRVLPAGDGVVHLERLDLDRYVWRTVGMRRLHAGRARFTLGAPGVYRSVAQARGGLDEAASRSVPFRPGAFRN
jgi:plastocyanin